MNAERYVDRPKAQFRELPADFFRIPDHQLDFGFVAMFHAGGRARLQDSRSRIKSGRECNASLKGEFGKPSRKLRALLEKSWALSRAARRVP